MKKYLSLIIFLFVLANLSIPFFKNVWAGNCSSCSSDSCSTSRGSCVNGVRTGTTTCTSCIACNPPSSYWGCPPSLGGACDNGYLGFKTRGGSRVSGHPTLACQVCGNGYKEGTEQCDDSNLVNGDGCSSTCILEYIDIGLKIFDGTQVVNIAIQPTGTVTSPLRIAKNGTIYGVVLVDITDSMASKMRINTSTGIKALRKL